MWKYSRTNIIYGNSRIESSMIIWEFEHLECKSNNKLWLNGTYLNWYNWMDNQRNLWVRKVIEWKSSTMKNELGHWLELKHQKINGNYNRFSPNQGICWKLYQPSGTNARWYGNMAMNWHVKHLSISHVCHSYVS